MEKKNRHKKKKKIPKIKSRKIKSDNSLTHKSDEDGLLIFQFDLFKPPWILKKLKSLFSKPNESEEDYKDWGLKV